MKTILTNNRTILCIEVPAEATEINVTGINVSWLCGRARTVLHIPEGKLIGTLLNSTTPVLDFDPEPFVETIMFDNEEDCKELFLSLLEANGMLMKNPMAKPYYGTMQVSSLRHQTEAKSEYEEKLQQWQSLEDKVIKKLIVIEKI